MSIYEPESLLAIRFIDGLTRDGEMNVAIFSAWGDLHNRCVFAHILLMPASFETGIFYFVIIKRSWGVECKSNPDAFGADGLYTAGR